jgi:hypothetical protein
LKEARRRNLSYKLTRVLANCLKDRVVVFDNLSGTIIWKIFAGVPWGSVVGPLLWDLVYNGLLARFENYVNLGAIAFAEDLVIMVGLNKTGSMGGVLLPLHENDHPLV